MCGIVGAFTFDAFEKKPDERARTEASIFITTQLLQATVDRGKDATGISLMWADGNYTGLKMGIPSPEFIARFGETEKDFAGILKFWREYPKTMKVFMGHCRKSSVGNSFDNKNNHPIQIGDLILIHNGTLTNHEKIFDKLKSKRIGDVDSEAIGQLLHHYTNGGVEPFTPEIIKETSRRLHGTYSVLAVSGNNPYQVAQFRDGRPAEMVLVKPLKMVFIASEKKFLENVLFEYNKQAKLFASIQKLPFIKQADVQFKMLQDDSLAIWDLTTPITDETDIEDLYTWEKVPLRVDKVWGTTTTYQNNNTAVGNQKKSTLGTEVETSQKKSKNNGKVTAGKDDPDGLVWSRSMNQYKTQEGIEKSKTMGSVTIDVDSGVISGGAEDKEILEVKEVDSTNIENLLVGPASTKEVDLKRAKDVVDKKSDRGKELADSIIESEKDGITDPGNIVEIDMTADAEALRAAGEFIENGLTKYENDDEVVNDLEVSDLAIIRPLPLYALANRIKKFIFKLGFITGYISRKKEDATVHLGTVAVSAKKLDKAELKIRIMKLTIKIMAECLEMRCRGNSVTAIKDMVKMAVSEIKSGSSPIKADLTAAFSVGDIKNIPLLEEIKRQINME